MAKTVYIGGNICSLINTKEVNERFRDIQERLEALGLEVLNPVRGKKLGIEFEPNEIVHRDEHDLDRADLMVAQIDGKKVTIGTPMEIYRAREICGIPVIVITDSDFIRRHYWIKSKTTKVVSSVDEAIEYIKEWYL